MKYLYIILLCMLGITSCFPTHYFEPEIGDTSKVEGKISHKGDTCWFEVEYQHVMTKFQPGTERTLSELIEGKTAVLELWASWCRSCRVNAREYRTQAKWLKALEEDAYPWPNMVALEDSHHIWTQYGCPDKAGRTLLIDRNGIIVKIDPSKDEIEQYIKANL